MKLENMTKAARVCTVLNKLNEIANKPVSATTPDWLIEFGKAEQAALEKMYNLMTSKREL